MKLWASFVAMAHFEYLPLLGFSLENFLVVISDSEWIRRLKVCIAIFKFQSFKKAIGFQEHRIYEGYAFAELVMKNQNAPEINWGDEYYKKFYIIVPECYRL